MAKSRTLASRTHGNTFSFSIRVNGDLLPSTIHILDILVDKEINAIPFARITISEEHVSNRNFSISNQSIMIPGNEVEIFAGYKK